MHRPRTRTDSLYFDYPIYPFRRPPEADAARPLHQVVIAGGGPSGLIAALDLARFGIASVVVEADETVSEGSRAACVSRRSMEIFQLDAVDRTFLTEALPWVHGTSYYRAQPVYRLTMPHSDDERFHPMANLQQNIIEQCLVERVHAQRDLIDLRWQSKVAAVTENADSLTLTIDTPEGEYPLTSRWLIAADGARSTLRNLLGLKLNGESFEGRYLIADIKMASAYPTERRAWFDPPTNRGNTVLMHKMARDIWRIDYQLADDADEAFELNEARVRKRIGEHLDWIGETTPWQLDWVRLYKAHCLCLDDYRRGRVFFVGDAAHLVPIFGVRGMNSSVADANNLAWKLALVLRGAAPDALLDSYSPERRAATFDIFDNARKSTLFMTPPTRGYKLMRDAALQLATTHDWAKPFVNPRQSAPYDYVDSTLTTADSDAWASGPRPGAPLASVRVRDAADSPAYLTDCMARAATVGFVLLVFSPGDARDRFDGLATPTLSVQFVERERGPRADWIDPGGRAHALYDARPGAAYLVRPDGHVCARWRAAEAASVEAALARALGAATTPANAREAA